MYENCVLYWTVVSSLVSPGMIEMAGEVEAVLGVAAPRQPLPLPHEARCPPLPRGRGRGRARARDKEKRAGRWWVGNASPRNKLNI